MRNYIARLVGWSDPAVIDRAYRSVRLAVHRVVPLVIAGDDNLIAIARAIHRRALGDRPFVVCDPRRRHGERCADEVRSAPSEQTAVEAIRRAAGGTVFLHSHRLPADFGAVRGSLRSVHLFVCRPLSELQLDGWRPFELDPIIVPRPGRRPGDLARIVDEYAIEAGVTDAGDREWVLEHSSSTHEDIEKGCRRVVALRQAATIAGAAELLGMAPVSLTRWCERRTYPPAWVQRHRVRAHRAPSPRADHPRLASISS